LEGFTGSDFRSGHHSDKVLTLFLVVIMNGKVIIGKKKQMLLKAQNIFLEP